ncbi:MAG: hypothetical protein IJ704_01225 [Bacilli bacterium]|nr:hypothetical protein [Bacilli bacterium]
MKLDFHHILIQPVSYEGKLEIPESYYKNTEILELPEVEVSFSIRTDLNQDEILSLKASGSFYLRDSKTLERVEYPYHFEIEEKIEENEDFFDKKVKNSKNSLDIIEFLWENIVLEIPISYSIAGEDALNGDHEGYRVAKEGEKKSEVDPRLAPLLGLLDKEKE